jgi:hypothetical protein
VPAARSGQREPAWEYWSRTAAAGAADPPRPAATAESASRQKVGAAGQATQAEAWLIPPFGSLDGKDSLGRGLDNGSVAAAIAANGAVQREREARWSYLQGAYRDPYAARAALDELVKREGWTSAAARLAREPEQLGELRGKVGWLASASAKQERVGAQRAAGALPGSLERISEAKSRQSGVIARAWRPSVRRMRPASRACPPQPKRRSAPCALRLTRSPRRGVAERAGKGACRRRASELRRRRRAAVWTGRVREMLRAGGRPGAVTAPSLRPEQRPELNRVADLTTTLKAGERAGASLARRQSESEREGQRRILRM